jgi:hypothetical protein
MASKNALRFRCRACAVSWDEPFPLPMAPAAWTKRVMRVHCPNCDAGHVGLEITGRGTRKPPPAAMTLPLEDASGGGHPEKHWPHLAEAPAKSGSNDRDA